MPRASRQRYTSPAVTTVVVSGASQGSLARPGLQSQTVPGLPPDATVVVEPPPIDVVGDDVVEVVGADVVVAALLPPALQGCEGGGAQPSARK